MPLSMPFVAMYIHKSDKSDWSNTKGMTPELASGATVKNIWLQNVVSRCKYSRQVCYIQSVSQTAVHIICEPDSSEMLYLVQDPGRCVNSTCRRAPAGLSCSRCLPRPPQSSARPEVGWSSPLHRLRWAELHQVRSPAQTNNKSIYVRKRHLNYTLCTWK